MRGRWLVASLGLAALGAGVALLVTRGGGNAKSAGASQSSAYTRIAPCTDGGAYPVSASGLSCREAIAQIHAFSDHSTVSSLGPRELAVFHDQGWSCWAEGLKDPATRQYGKQNFCLKDGEAIIYFAGAPPAPCKAAQLALQTRKISAGLGTTYDDSWVRNIDGGLGSCMLSSRLRPDIVRGGSEVVLKGRPGSETQPLWLDGGQSAEVLVGWSNWCKPTHGIYELRLDVPGGGSITNGKHYGPAGCSGPPSSKSILSIASFKRGEP